MVPKWLKAQDRREAVGILNRDAPPVPVVGTSNASIPKTDFAYVSVYQPSITQGFTTIHSAVSPDRNLFHLILVSTRHGSAHAPVVSRASKQAWLDVSVLHNRWNSPFHIVEDHLERLAKMIFDVARSSLEFDHIGLSIDRIHQTISLGTSMSGAITTVDRDLKLQSIDTSRHAYTVGEKKSSVFTPELLQPKPLRSLVLTPQLTHDSETIDAISKVLATPYPLAGAAELTYFALQECGRASDVTWIELLKTI